jgi:hypothetical protein
MNEEKQVDALSLLKSDKTLIKILKIIGIALVIILGMLVASGILFNAAVVQITAP